MEYILLLITFCLYAVSFAAGLFNRRQLSLFAAYLGLILHLVLLIWRSVTAQHPPFTTMYETLILLTALMQLKFLFFQRHRNARILNVQKALLLIFLAVPVFLPAELRAVHPVMPALNSAWMYVHVPAYLLGYVALFSGLIHALLRFYPVKNIFDYDKQMDTDIALAMVFMSAGLITGAIWGQVSWGNYWSWDPKETWALINILVLSLYFHKKDRIIQSMIIIVTVMTVLFTYFGVSFLMSGLHAY
ncbi:MAG: cytochrome c biogenesis protein CcsA [Candidatus Marinimicrobia bacterium]|nr:cytochrome c biogenesis protein CcsA [Candidatus Neomarinimicrobiota bacterium]